jgi:xylulokinase
LLSAALESGREAVEQAREPEIGAVGIAALGPAPLLVDERLEPLTPACLFALDRRAEAQRVRLGVSDDHALPKLFWWQENEPELFARAAWALDATGYLVASLTGRPTMDSITRTAYEHPEVEAGVPLPPALDPLAEAGGLQGRAAQALGLPDGTPVAAGTYDTYVDISGLGAPPGAGCLLLGSTLAVYTVVTEETRVGGLELTRYPGEGWLLGGTSVAGGRVLGWLESLLGFGAAERADAAAVEPGAGGLVALPYFSGERAPFSDPDARGGLVGLTLATNRAELYRAFLDALALVTLALAETLPVAGSWRASGGGCRNDAWLSATCDALGAPLQVVEHAGEAVGPVRLALRSLGLEPPVRIERTVEPDTDRSEAYRALLARSRDFYDRIRR